MPQAPVHTSPAGDAPVEPEAEVETPAGAEAGGQAEAEAEAQVEATDDVAGETGSAAPRADLEDSRAAAAMVPAQVDELLLEILDTEVAGHLAVVDGWLDAVRAGGPAAADDALLRAVHTMNGAFAMAEVPAITGVLSPAESWVRRLLAGGGDADADAVEAVGELAALVRASVQGLKSAPPGVPECDALAARWSALRDALPEPGRSPFEASGMPGATDAEAEEVARLEAQLL